MNATPLGPDDDELALFAAMYDKSPEELYQVIRAGSDDEKHAAASRLCSYAERPVFLQACTLCQEAAPALRAEGAYLLGQLGAPNQPFGAESVPILMSLLADDPVAEVRGSAAAALGHLGAEQALPLLISSIHDPDAEVRFYLACALGNFDTAEAAAALIELSADADEDVRDWATFGLGSCLSLDTPALRAALVARLSEENAEIRGEALIGLAKRRDMRVMDPLMQELRGPFHGDWCFEAAECLADPRLHPLLVALRESILGDVAERFIAGADAAIAACAPSV